MLQIPGSSGRYCDGLSRRSFLQIGGLGFGGLALPEILKAEASTGTRRSEKAVIMILLPGGLTQLDSFDLKPYAPAEIRGEFNPIATKVPGIEISELMPRLAGLMDKFVIIRSLVGALNDHNLHQCLTGWESHPQQGDSRNIPGYPEGGWPSMGSVLAKVHGPIDPAVPPFVSLAPPKAESTTRASLNQAGYLGSAFEGFEPNKMAEGGITLDGITLNRLEDRRALLASLDRVRSRLDSSAAVDGIDAHLDQAFGILTSNKIADALDLNREDPRLRAKYGVPKGTPATKSGPKLLEQFLVARRLIDAGVRCVTLAFSRYPLERESRGGHNWDWHNGNFEKAKLALPMLDQGLAALIEDLHATGRLDDVSIVVWGEFGRTPRINNSAGRDHWPRVSSCLVAGGGIRAGQVIGATDGQAGSVIRRPIHYRDIFATLYHNVGIDAANTILHDRSERPHALVDNREPIAELI